MCTPFSYDSSFDTFETVEIDLAPIGVGDFC